MKPPAKCGTPSGYEKHRRNGEDACQPCKDAAAAYKREYLARRPEVNAKQNAYTAAHSRALVRLAGLHRAEFEALLAEERAS